MFKKIGDKIDILIKSITLIYRELLVNRIDKGTDFSIEIVGSILKIINKDNSENSSLGTNVIILDSLTSFLHKLINNIDTYSEEDILDNITTILKDDKNLLETVLTTLNKDLESAALKRSVVSLRLQLKNTITEFNIVKKVFSFVHEIKSNPYTNIMANTKDLVLNLDLLTISTGDTIPGIIADINTKDSTMTEVLKTAKALSDGTGTFKFGFREFNTMTQNRVKRGDSILIPALQHEYKSGLTQSLFMQIPMYNIPKDINPKMEEGKIPLVLYISFEDDPEVFAGFMYKYLYCAEHKTLPDLSNITPEDMQNYIHQKLSVNGYETKMLRVNPSEWTYKELFSYILLLESQGYDIHAVIIDYLVKMDVTGCVGKGGTEYRDLWDRCRQFFSVKKILFISPHQMSTEAKQLVRNGTNKLNLVKEVVSKGYTELSKQIDQVVDIEICIAKALMNKKWVLTMMIGKHRGAEIIPDEQKYQILRFPLGMPIPPNVDDPNYVPVKSDNKEEEDLFAM